MTEEYEDENDIVLKLAEINAIIDGLNACMIVYDNEQKADAIKIINGLEAIKVVAK